jgi:hypothetical protein
MLFGYLSLRLESTVESSIGRYHAQICAEYDQWLSDCLDNSFKQA